MRTFKKVFGLNLIGNKVKELVNLELDYVAPEKWVWEPFRPDKIRNIKEHMAFEKKETNYAIITNYEPSLKKQKIVLVFAMGNLTYSFIKNLEKQNLKFFYIDYPQFILKGNIEIVITNGNSTKILKYENFKLNLDDVKVVIWTEPKYPFPLYNNEIMPLKNRNKFLFKKRWALLLKELHLLVDPNTLWLPSIPSNGSQDWQNKIGELEMAKNIGFKIPPTIFSNNEIAIKNFVNNDDVLLREFSTAPYSFPPIPIKDISKINFKHIENSPCCFQKYINKKYEYRVVVLNDRVFPCRIYSQDSSLAKNDWRVHDDANVKWELIELPKPINEKLIQMSTMLNLKWCSFDLIEDPFGDFYFLEVNRPGAHYWLDLFVGLDISKEIVKYIKNEL